MMTRFEVQSPEQLLELYRLRPLKKHRALCSGAAVWAWDLVHPKPFSDPDSHRWTVCFYQAGHRRVAEVSNGRCIFPLAELPYNKCLKLCWGWSIP